MATAIAMPDDPYKKKCEMLVAEAKRWIGVQEKGGDNHGPEVELFQKAVDGKAQGESWCLAFVQFCAKQVDKKFKELYGSDPIPCALFATEHCMTLWNNTPVDRRVKGELHPGCLILWQHWNNGFATTSGHVGIIIDVKGLNTLTTVEGNTGPGTEVEREGDGVFQKERSVISKSTKMKLKGFIMVWNHEKSKE